MLFLLSLHCYMFGADLGLSVLNSWVYLSCLLTYNATNKHFGGLYIYIRITISVCLSTSLEITAPGK